tara:strand:- start:1999 stop:4017 length:2019 start_codon:yes stop_codon:yes gene_type:complete
MQNIELYIEGKRLDLFGDESVSLTQTIKNAKDVAKVFTSFTQTFNVPASKSNNLIFKHYYNFDLSGGFDARTKKAGTIELNSYPFKEGKIKLEGVTLKENIAYAYKLTFFGNTVDLNDLIGEDKLNQLVSLNSLSLDYNSNEIKSRLQADPTTNNIITPLITSGASGATSRLFYDSGNTVNTESGNLDFQSGNTKKGVLFTDLKFALRISKIIEAIETQYSLTFSNDFFNSTNLPYFGLFMWLHRKKGNVESGSAAAFVNTIDGWSVASDEKSEMINSSTFKINNEDNVNSLVLKLSRSLTNSYDISIQRDGQVIFTRSAITTSFEQVVLTNFINVGSEYTVTVSYDSQVIFNSVAWEYDYDTQGGAETDVFSTSTYVAPAAFEFNITSQIPDIKILDFLTGIFKMFNLVAFLNDVGVVVVKTLDSFYSGGVNYDISSYIDVKTSAVNVALPYKEIVFDYKDNKTLLAAIHTQLFSYTWAKLEHNGGENLDGGIYNVELPFSHFKFEKLLDVDDGSDTGIQWGYCVDDNSEAYIGAPFLFYVVNVSSGNSISYRSSITTHDEISSYNVPSNSLALSAVTSKDNINFKNELNEYTGNSDFTDTLFEKYYKNYITNIFNSKNRLTKVTAFLPLKILLNFTLADRFDINGRRYKINSIKTNLKTGKSEIELLNEL